MLNFEFTTYFHCLFHLNILFCFLILSLKQLSFNFEIQELNQNEREKIGNIKKKKTLLQSIIKYEMVCNAQYLRLTSQFLYDCNSNDMANFVQSNSGFPKATSLSTRPSYGHDILQECIKTQRHDKRMLRQETRKDMKMADKSVTSNEDWQIS